jgi:hypothetical protein
MTRRAPGRTPRGQAPRLARRRAAADATTEPDPGPPPEAVFDRVTGPSPRRAALAMPGACGYDEGP